MTKPRLGALFILLASVLALTGLQARDRSAQAQEAPRPAAGPVVPVSVAKAKLEEVPLWFNGLGAVQALNAVQLRPRVDGTLMQVPVTEGQDVKQGDVLAVIDPRPYQAILDQAMAKKQQDQSLLQSAQSDLARYTALAQQEIASRQKFETVKALVGQLQAAIVADEATIAAAQLNLGFCYISAPFNARVGLRNVDPGNFVRAAEATPLFSLAQIQPISMTFTLPQDKLPAVQDAMALHELQVVAYASDNTTLLDTGTLLTVDNAIDSSTGTIKLKAVFPNAKRRLWPGQFVNARLMVRSDKDQVTVPTSAVMHSQTGLYAFVVKPDQTVARQDVEIAREYGGLSIVSKGLAAGDTVVTDGQSRLQAGSKVAIGGPPPAQASKVGG